MTITDWPASERPRERLLARGADALSDAELLALLLRTGSGARDAVQLARDLLASYSSLRALLDAPISELTARPGIGPAKAATLNAWSRSPNGICVRVAARGGLHARRSTCGAICVIGSAQTARSVRRAVPRRAASADRIPRDLLRHDRQRDAFIRARCCAKRWRFNAAAVILVHNHPSGVAEPSVSDVMITERLRQVLQLIDVRVLDHIVVTTERCTYRWRSAACCESGSLWYKARLFFPATADSP